MPRGAATAPFDPAWARRLDALAAATSVPDPGSDDYTELVWAFARERAGRLDADQLVRLATLPHTQRRLARDAWVRRYLECAERSFAGRPLQGGARAHWLTTQRRARERGQLAAGRVQLLERLDGFTWTPNDDRWHHHLEKVRAFTSEHGRLPARRDDLAAAAWLASQRFLLRAGQVRPGRAEELASLPGWTESLAAADRNRAAWAERVAELERFLEGDGCYPDPHAEDPAEVELARWVTSQRKAHRGGDLSAQRTAVLVALPNWRWTEREASFDRRICELRHSLDGGPVTTAHPLYSWVLDQRRRHREGRLTDQQREALRELGLLPAGAA